MNCACSKSQQISKDEKASFSVVCVKKRSLFDLTPCNNNTIATSKSHRCDDGSVQQYQHHN